MSNIEEDIKILENLKKYLNLLIYEGTHKIIYNDLGWDEKTIDCINAIDHILEEREEDKKRIEELEDRCKSHQKLLYEAAEVEKNGIPKQKVKDKIELHKYYLLNQAITSNPTLDSHFRDKEKYVIQVLQKLLEGEK